MTIYTVHEYFCGSDKIICYIANLEKATDYIKACISETARTYGKKTAGEFCESAIRKADNNWNGNIPIPVISESILEWKYNVGSYTYYVEPIHVEE